MLLFRPEHREPIQAGRKTQTRRLWKRCRVRLGATHKCYLRPPHARGGSEPFASAIIIGTRQEPLEQISDDDVQREGYASREEYFDAFCAINRLPRARALELVPWVVDFRLPRRLTWDVYPWPEWVPEQLRVDIQEFWGPRSQRKPWEWLRDAAQGPAFGSTVYLHVVGPGNDHVRGRYVHRWNNIGAVVSRDGSYRIGSFDTSQRSRVRRLRA